MWNWESVSQSLANQPGQVLGLLNTRMKALEQYLGQADTTFSFSKKVYTTDATVTTLATEAIGGGKTVHVEGRVVGRRTGGSAGSAEDAASYTVVFLAKNVAGTATVIGSSVAVIGESQAAWNCAVSASSGNVLVRVTGAASNNVTWVWSRVRLTVTDDS